MKAKVVLKLAERARLLLENGSVMALDQAQMKQLNSAMRQGDIGVLEQQPNGVVKFRIDAEDVDLRPVPTPAIINTPKETHDA